MRSANSRFRLSLLILALAVAAAATACGTTATVEDVAPPTADPAEPAVEGPIADGQHFGFASDLSPDGSFFFDSVEFLSGQEAVDAARAAGDLPEGEDSLPNDFYILNEAPDSVRLSLADSSAVTVFDCTEACTPVTVNFADLASGAARAFNGDQALYQVTVEDGAVVALDEQYLP
ncbi:MAG TPA: hypothetical protein VML96_11655 [Egibacteraceae bacterium]|nr:hypothetical protein [Egibacteraceae bacterium]